VAGPIAGAPRCSRLSAVVVAAALLAGCGGSHSHAQTQTQTGTRTQTQPRATPGGGGQLPPSPKLKPADPKRVAIVRAWADALRAGHVRKASSYFAIPTIVQNGGPALLLRSRVGVRVFNGSLPCGARVLRAVRVESYTIVTFKLTERRGNTPGCGSGRGHLAATAFAFRHGKISEWRRVTVPPAGAKKARPKAGPTV